ncbi:MAG: acyltransferase [Lachnospiraceae bacterium]|nr:acyltransferase [Lachnospiraceae bacterium]
MKKKSTNLQLFRFLATLGVIHWHSYTLTSTPVEGYHLYDLTRGQLGMWHIGFYFLFLVAGYFAVTGMVRKSEGYIPARLKRLLPALVLTVLLSEIMGAFVTTLSFSEYISSPGTYLYLLNAVMVPIHGLPGVFLTHEKSTAVNGALWTLPVEFAGYVGVWLLWKLKLLNKKAMTILLPVVMAAGIALVIYGGAFGIRYIHIYPVMSFYLGMTLAIYKAKVPWLCFGCPVQVPEWLAKPGDISYEMYLLGFPIQQCIVEYAPGLSQWQHFLLAAAVDIPAAFLLHLAVQRIYPLLNKKKV